MGKHASNKTMTKFPQGNNTASQKAVISSTLARIATSTKYVYRRRSSNKSDILLTKFGPAENTQYERKEVEHQDEFINY